MVDADRSSVEARLQALDAACTQTAIAPRRSDDLAAVLVPRRNIETWIEYLSGNDIDEETVYPKLNRERDCAIAVRVLKSMCDKGSLRTPAPPSLEAACIEYWARIQRDPAKWPF